MTYADDNLDLKQLRYFLAVAETGGYAKAAEKLDITQQAVSAAITRLEASLQAKLFIRNQGGTQITDAGRALYKRALVILEDTRAAAREVRMVAQGELGDVRVGVADDPSGGVLPRSVYALCKQHPKILVSIAHALNRDLKEDLLEGKLDLVVAAPWQPWQSNKDLIVEEIYSTQLTLVCGANHPLAGREEVSLEDMQKFPWLVPSPPSPIHNEIIRAYRRANLHPPERVTYCDSIVSGQALLTYGEHIVPSHRATNEPLIEKGLLATLPMQFDFGYKIACLAYRRQAILNESTKMLISMIHTQAKDEGDSTPILAQA